MKRYAILVGGGSGSRMQQDIPKQFLLVAGKPVLMHTLEAFYQSEPRPEIIVVLNVDYHEYWEKLCKTHQFSIPHTLVKAGQERFFSVKNGLKFVKGKALVAIHDAVRPIIKKDKINERIKYKKDILFYDVVGSNLLDSSGNKLKIYKYEFINSYDKIIFCDLDTLWIKSPDILFDKITDDKIYMSCETSLMSGEYWNIGLLNESELKIIRDNNILGLNAGFIGFKSSMVPVIKEMDEFFESHKHNVNSCLEQPYINTFLFRNSLYDNSLTELISHNGYNLTTFDGVLLHFAGGAGFFQHKFNIMSKYKI
jgi:2-C-methyl-D-erythritol 4-phosphate cytidylyltransferase